MKIPPVSKELRLDLRFIGELSQPRNIDWKKLNKEVMSLWQSGQYDRAKAAAKEALDIAEAEVGPDHLDVAISLDNLAWVYSIDQQHAQAEPLYKQALSIREKALGPDHPDVATSLENIAALYRAEAKEFRKRARRITATKR